MSEVHRLGLRAIAARYADRSLTPLVLVEALLARIAALDPTLCSFVLVDHDGALAAARAATDRWASGDQRGPLDGIPVGIKDVIDVAGLPTRCHSATTSAVPATADAAIVTLVRDGGTIILGKLATHEYAIGGPAFDLPFPPARNPWNVDHHPGGSSSGAGAAVAAGLVPLAIGTDTAGSVRNPASACGIVGLKPGRGLLPLGGIVPLAWSLDHVGLLTRSADDMAIAAAALGIPLAASKTPRIGYVRHWHDTDMPADPDVAFALNRVAATLGAVDITLPPLGHYNLANRVILQAEGFAAHESALRNRPADLCSITRATLLPGAFTSAEMLIDAHRLARRLTAATDVAFLEVDLLLTASSMTAPCRFDDPAEIARTYLMQARSPFNVTGHPALAMMAGVSADGLPLSLQLAAPMGGEGALLAAAARWEAAYDGPRHPPGY